MNPRELKFLTVAAIVAVGLGLAGCGGGGSSSTPPAAGGGEPGGPTLAQKQEMQRAAINSAVTAARTAVNGVNNDSTDSEVGAADAAITALAKAISDATDLPDGDATVASAQGTHDTLVAQLATAKTARTAYLANKADDDMKAAAKLGKDLRAALGGAAANTNALANVTATTLGTAGLGVTAAEDAGALTGPVTVPTLKAVEGSATALGSWAGMMYSHTDTGTKVKNEAVVYHNQGAPKRQAFSGADGKYDLDDGSTTPANKGYLTTVAPADVGGTAFMNSGTQTHTPAPRANAVYLRGTYDGAAGEYRCTGTCTVTNDGKGSPSALGGTWHFKPDSGAMVSTPDAHYLYYGWWLNRDKDGKPMAASAFTGRVGTENDDSTDGLDPGWTGSFTAGTTLTGSATYAGHAAGKVAMSNALDGTGSGGHFTADAMLTAQFGTTNTGVTGTIDKFMVDGAEMPWSVALHKAEFGDNGAITTPATDDTSTQSVDETLGTTWSINGNAAPRSGTWSGMMYDEKPGNPPSGDGSTIPTTVTGTFYSEASTVGRMVGAFGADKQ